MSLGDPFRVANAHLADCLYRVSFRRCKPLKLPLSCEVVEKDGFGAPYLYGEGISHISDMRFSEIALTSEHVAGFG